MTGRISSSAYTLNRVASGGVVQCARDMRRHLDVAADGVNQIASAQDGSRVEAAGESEQHRIERLGRERPEIFRSAWSEIGFIFSVTMSQAMTEYFVSGFNVIIPTVVQSLNIPPASATWPANAFSLVVASFLLPFGRIADQYGGYPVYVAGATWLGLWAGIAAASQNQIMLDVCRAFQGLGPACYLPASLMLLGSIYRPGPRKNLIFGIYAAMAPLGLYLGIFFAGLTSEYSSWRWYFGVGAVLTFITAVISYFTVPSDVQERRRMGIKMDWWGSITSVVGLVLFVFAITESSEAPTGWANPYIIITLVLGVLFLALTVWVEGWVAEAPLLPAEIFRMKYMKPLFIALLIFYGNIGVYLYYATFYMQDIMGGTPLQLVAWFSPLAAGGLIIATGGSLVLHAIPGSVIILLACLCWIATPLLFALAPVGANYWAYVFPSMICATTAIDTTFNISNIYITTQMPLRYQGLAGALINVIVQLGIAIALGIADIVVTATAYQGLRQKYKNAFWLETAFAGLTFILLVGFVRIDKASSALTADELEAREIQEAETRNQRERDGAEGKMAEEVNDIEGENERGSGRDEKKVADGVVEGEERNEKERNKSAADDSQVSRHPLS